MLAANELSRLQTGVIAFLVAIAVAGSIVAFVRSRPREVKVRSTGGTRSASTINIHVAGAVSRPGLYRLKEGSRVDDAIQMAGGATPDASIDDLNIAARLKDGEKVMVPLKPQPTAQAQSGSVTGTSAVEPGTGTGSVNLNTASADELDTLPGIGPEYARRIVEYRARNGAFSSVDELDEVEGIGPKKLDSLKDLVTI